LIKPSKPEVKKRYTRTIGLAEPISVRNADAVSARISSDIVRSVRYWPLGTALQIDTISTHDSRLCVLFTQLGEHFPQWSEDIIDIVSEIAKIGTYTIKERDQIWKANQPRQMLELQPYSDTVNFRPEDISREMNVTQFDYDTMTAEESGEINEYQFRTRTVIPETRLVDTTELIRKVSHSPGTTIRTVLRPVSEERANEVRTNLLKDDYVLQTHVDANASVVDIRCFVCSTNEVSVGIKRMTTAMASDVILSEIPRSQIESIWKNSLDAVVGFSRICLTAASFIRLPALEYFTTPTESRLHPHHTCQDDSREQEITKLKDELQGELTKQMGLWLDDLGEKLTDVVMTEARDIAHSAAYDLLYSLQAGEVEDFSTKVRPSYSDKQSDKVEVDASKTAKTALHFDLK
jgi:hypothetical protein